MIFVVADSATGRLIGSQLRFFGAADIAVYATADILDLTRTTRDNDLNGFIFAAAPALVTPNEEANGIRAEVQTYWPQRSAQLLPYHGMGFDAYGLVASLYANDAAPWSMHGLSGDLSLDDKGRVRRSNLPLAQFRNGRPVAVETEQPRSIDTRSVIGQR
jgi:outer membrane PBP1 activator LpoA protein